jgi:hypothetical protein
VVFGSTYIEAETVTADVVILDHVIVFNRLGSQNVNGIIYALKRDVVDAYGTPLTQGGDPTPGQVRLRDDKRARPLVLRVSAGDTLVVNFTNLLTPAANPFPPLPDEANPCDGCDMNNPLFVLDNQVAGRWASFHPQGLELATSIDDDGSYVGENDNSLTDVAPGNTKTYRYLAKAEGTFLVTSMGATFGGEATGGNVGVGAMGSVNVQPANSRFYRSQVTEEELRLATTSTNAEGYPTIDYEATYPNKEPWISEGKANLPILNMLTEYSKGKGKDKTRVNELVHSDINAIIAGSNADGSFPSSTYPLEAGGERNPTVPNRLEPYREFTVIFHDEVAAANAFPAWFRDDINPVIAHTTHGVRDSFMINYGSGGIGSEIIANRLGVGPMWDCLDCAYEEFFLTSFTVGDPAMLVDVPANTGLEECGANLNPAQCADVGPKAGKAFYPDDPSNVHHSYTGDFVKFRNLHAGPKEQHIFHLHNHQWLFNANDDNSNYLDAQGIGPGSGYTYEINFGGSGNRNKTAGDAIFHCHFYPHFAQGMWELWRVHDTLEVGTELAASGGDIHTARFALKDGTPAPGARALPDSEILAGTPIPAVVPLPGKPIAPVPGRVELVTKNTNPGVDDDPVTPGVQELPEVSVANVIDRDKNPGFPFWIAGVDCGGPDGLADATGCRDGILGQRPSTPPLDMLTKDDAIVLSASGDPLFSNPGLVASAGGFDGGLPRHALEGFIAAETPGIPGRADPNVAVQNQTRFDFRKVIHKAKPVYFPEEGTDLEQAAMAFHSELHHDTFLPDGSAATGSNGFRTNGQPPAAGAPYMEPCIDDEGTLFVNSGKFFGSTAGSFFTAAPQFGATNPRVYKAANIQVEAIFNKVGYHFPQQRIISLWGDVMPTINQQKPAEPFVIRMNTFDCTMYYHSNLVPSEYELDDYQVRTPTDIIGQHIHLPKWDLTSADGSANGWNYEDGTLSPQMVIERIEAINNFNDDPTRDDIPTLPKPDGSGGGLTHLVPATPTDPDYPIDHKLSLGARVTIQRWFADPVVNVRLEDRGLGMIFTHDHYGPSSVQQVGLYATVLAEPARSIWKHNETGVQLATRGDGGPTSWQAIIEPTVSGGAGQVADAEAYREFYFEFGDFQHAYEAGTTGIMPNAVPDSNMFRSAINPSFRQQAENGPAAPDIFPDIVRFPPFCPGGVPRPCPEAISADDVGMLAVNYRNEPVGLRVFDPNKPGPDGDPGSQADGAAGDLAFALASEIRDKAGNATDITRAIPEMNMSPAQLNFFGGATLNSPTAVKGGDPFTPMLRAYPGDPVRIKIQAGATEHEHNATVHGVKWLQSGSGHGSAPNSGWRNAQNDGISEQFGFKIPVNADPLRIKGPADYAYSVDASQDGWWSGMWGLLRVYDEEQDDLEPLNFTRAPSVVNADEFVGVCPAENPGAPTNKRVPANLREYTVIAMTANELLDNPLGATIVPGDASATMHVGGALDPQGGTLVYNPRDTALLDPLGLPAGAGPLHDPTALLFVNAQDLEPVPGQMARVCGDNNTQPGVANPACAVQLKAGQKPEPLVLRAAAGECIEVTLYNRLPEVAPDLAGYNTLLQMVLRNRNADPCDEEPLAPGCSVTTFNNNLIRPSSRVGLHAQLVEYDVTQHDGSCVGVNACVDGTNTVGPPDADGKLDRAVTYRWYAGDLEFVPEGNGVRIVPTPVEFGGVNLIPADKIKQGQKAMVGALVIVPEGATWTEDAGQHASATVDPGTPENYGDDFRDFAVIFQKGLNQRFADGSAVENIASEGQGIPEDSHDAGQTAINFGTEPAWFRFGLAADAPFGKNGGEMGAVADAHLFYSNDLPDQGTPVGDPVTPVFTALGGQQVRMRVLEPTGVGRGTTFDLHGHIWQRDPYIAGAVPSQSIGNNPIGFFLGHQESVTPAAHFDIVLPSAGGTNQVPGDYLFKDHGSFGNTNGLWGILRVLDTPAEEDPDEGGGGKNPPGKGKR